LAAGAGCGAAGSACGAGAFFDGFDPFTGFASAGAAETKTSARQNAERRGRIVTSISN
jgi:hypothetical protein